MSLDRRRTPVSNPSALLVLFLSLSLSLYPSLHISLVRSFYSIADQGNSGAKYSGARPPSNDRTESRTTNARVDVNPYRGICESREAEDDREL